MTMLTKKEMDEIEEKWKTVVVDSRISSSLRQPNFERHITQAQQDIMALIAEIGDLQADNAELRAENRNLDKNLNDKVLEMLPGTGELKRLKSEVKRLQKCRITYPEFCHECDEYKVCKFINGEKRASKMTDKSITLTICRKCGRPKEASLDGVWKKCMCPSGGVVND